MQQKKIRCKRKLIGMIIKDPYLTEAKKKDLLRILGREYVDYMKVNNMIPALKEASDISSDLTDQVYDQSGDTPRLRNAINRLIDKANEAGIKDLTLGTITELILSGNISHFKGFGKVTVGELCFKLITIYKGSGEDKTKKQGENND